ncbi:MAG: TIGR01777 family oxidoreductase, partial [Flavobacteriales bacterium]|nr:TIGR01777 family oxidoreductase [Flavobacteriales bacterium]
MNSLPKMIIAGGSGFFGNHLVEYFKKTYRVVVLTRSESKLKEGVQYINWDAKTIGEWVDELNGATVLINLTGKSINCRFTEENKKELLSSRTDSTKVLAEAIYKLEKPPKIWMNASAGAMYQTADVPNTEEDEVFKDDFLAQMAIEWEKAFFENELPKTKRVAMRISLILGKDGGVFPVWKKITKLFLGGKVGDGKQMISWIHIDDAVEAVKFIIKKEIEGIVNFSTNQPISNKDLMKELRKQ